MNTFLKKIFPHKRQCKHETDYRHAGVGVRACLMNKFFVSLKALIKIFRKCFCRNLKTQLFLVSQVSSDFSHVKRFKKKRRNW